MVVALVITLTLVPAFSSVGHVVVCSSMVLPLTSMVLLVMPVAKLISELQN